MNDPDYKKPNLQLVAAMLGVIALSALVIAFVGPMVYKKGLALTIHPQVDQTFYVATKAGEAFEVKAMHQCGEGNMRKAAIHATHNQDERINPDSYKFLEAITMDHARIYEGHIKEGTRCDITGVVFRNITGHAYIVEEN